ncbi:alpha/beta hydrolase [Actinoplanes utahensis]|uniref:DUF1023 domain-containing protein n=1 Tax=Actinoplanes utahensis TaxID=1869 RepID=A0A0A6UCF7_ACTUT|nr:alpha/beta hydrolase [Actinoplanes utahensis]KHD73730.1 hypothetical protein MB27_32235 [Actinoplanes utahensis]GIF27916.1 hypothetical protein Aut01nite_09020 [Actinoplanes utahensis]
MSGAAVTYARLRATDPARWQAAALAWRRWATLAGALCAEFDPLPSRLRASWSGAAAEAAAARIGGLLHRLTFFRVLCWRADQALCEFAAALVRARALLDRARGTARRAGLVIDDSGAVRGRPEQHGSIRSAAADLSAALGLAAEADSAAVTRLGTLIDMSPAPPVTSTPSCTATPAEVRQWWDRWSPAERAWLLATDPAAFAGADGIPVADRDIANRLLLAGQRVPPGADPGRAGDLRTGLARLSARLESDDGPRAYLVKLGLDQEGRAVVALGDPDRAGHVLTHVPGMTSDLKSLGGELERAERVAVRAGELDPARAASAVLWLDYDAPDFVPEASSARQAEDAAAGLRRFQEGLRAGHDGEPARQTLLGHSYGSLVAGRTAATGPVEADSLVFVGSPGVGVDAVSRLSVPADRVFSTTSATDPIQYAATAPKNLVGGPLAVWAGRDELWFGANPSHPGFGARIFASQIGAGHLGYWDRDRPALDSLARITLGEQP